MRDDCMRDDKPGDMSEPSVSHGVRSGGSTSPNPAASMSGRQQDSLIAETSPPALDDRKAAILYAVVQEYIRTAQPVGSGRVAGLAGIDASPATIRNEMAALSEQHYLTQPHTSAGRVPTAKGYRCFVDQWRRQSPAPVLDAADRRQVNKFFSAPHGGFESILSDTTGLLSDLTDWTAVVVAPSPAAATVRSAQLVELSSTTVLVVAVMSNGVIEKRNLEVPVDIKPEVVADASERLARRIVGRTLVEIGDCDPPDDMLLAAAITALQEARAHHEVFVGGTSKLAAAFDAVEQLSEVLSLLEQQLVVVTLMRRVIDGGRRVAIGEETGVPSLADCSLVLAPYSTEDTDGGAIGVIGPTRMDYPQALSAVAAVSRKLGSALGEV
ncbi:MAG: heat-inducible transcriptional repressor HrcA [Acidimicrobiaceae bacterium]|nr:heat-inducible transcriptional repressor HrcA [Acidimicrobiaceae bacterium]MCY4280050.1 heat-inducible transcriptional repressor HrcA [Acidimicrobiaceae bacterium]MCY4293653.1 heat-inducible transcriptional repressor HrcA [Acidimicrobiaceae bacterium]